MPNVFSKFAIQHLVNEIDEEEAKLRLELFKTIINKTPEHINVRDNNGNTPLMKLCINWPNEYNNIKFLLDHGACPNIPDKYGNIPYLELERQGYNDACQLLVDYGSKTKMVKEFTSSSSNKININTSGFQMPSSCSLTEFTEVLSKYIPELNGKNQKRKYRKIIIK